MNKDQLSRKILMNKPQERCEKIVEQIIKSKAGDFKELNTKTFAIQFGLTPLYLSGTFKKNKGANLHEYIWRLKMTNSALFLRENKHLKVCQIAELFGWDRSNAFINAFKRFFGISPGKFRNLMK